MITRLNESSSEAGARFPAAGFLLERCKFMISARRSWKRCRFAASVDLRLEDRRRALENRALIYVNTFLSVIGRKSRLNDGELWFGELDRTQRIGFVVLSKLEDRARVKEYEYNIMSYVEPVLLEPDGTINDATGTKDFEWKGTSNCYLTVSKLGASVRGSVAKISALWSSSSLLCSMIFLAGADEFSNALGVVSRVFVICSFSLASCFAKFSWNLGSFDRSLLDSFVLQLLRDSWLAIQLGVDRI